MATARNTIKQWFSNLKKPNQNHFWAWIDSFWHKEDKIPMRSVEGLEAALQDVPTSDQFSNHVSDTNAHKTLFDNKLDKGMYNGTAQDLKTAIDNINTILQSDDTELDQLQEIVNYIKQNKHILNQLGISNIAGLEDALNGKAEVAHTHSWNDLTDKPTISDGLPKTFPLGKKDSSHTLLIDNSLLEETNTFFLTANDNTNKHINLDENVKNYSVISFMKCFNNGNISFSHPNKTIFKLGADDFNGKKGSTAVVSVVDNEIFIQINNYE